MNDVLANERIFRAELEAKDIGDFYNNSFINLELNNLREQLIIL